MELSSRLLKKFADITNDASVRSNSGSTVYGTAVVRDGRKYVRIDGADSLTPVSEAADIRNEDRVLISVQDHTAAVVGNFTCPPSARTATDLNPVIEAESARISILEANRITTEYLEANYAKVGRLEALSAKIDTLEAGRITTEYLEANYAKIGRLEALSAQIGTLEANQITTEYLNANYAQIGLANVTQASVGTLFANIGLVSNMTISSGYITGELQGVTISANQITAGTIDAAAINVVNLNASNLTVGTINGQLIAPGSVSADALSQALQNRISQTETDVENALKEIDANEAAAKAMVDDLTKNLSVPGKIVVSAGNIPAGTIASTQIANNAIIAGKIAANAVTSDKIISNAITAVKIAANAVTADKISANAVTAGKIAANAVTAGTIAAKAVTAGNLNVSTLSAITANVGTLTSGIIRSSNYAAAASGNYSSKGVIINLSSGLIQTPNFAIDTAGNAYFKGNVTATGGSISGSLVTSGINAANISTGALSADRIAAGSLNGNKIISNTITATQIAASTITGAKIAGSTITAGNIAAGTITATQIAGGTITGAKIAGGTITADKLAAGSITADRIKVGALGGWTFDSTRIYSTKSNVSANIYSEGTNLITIEQNGNPLLKIERTGLLRSTSSITANSFLLNAITSVTFDSSNNTNINALAAIKITSGGYIYTNDSIAMTKTSTATTGLRVKNTKVSDYIFFGVNSNGVRGIYDYSIGDWILGMNASNQVYSKYIYTLTTTGSANVNVASNGVLRRHASSSQRYKHDIYYYSNKAVAVSDEKKRSALKRNEEELLSILKLPVCSFLYNKGYISDDVGYDPKRPVYGFIAEDVQNVSPDAVDYLETSNGEVPESWDVKKLFPKVVYVAQKHEYEINQYREVLFLLYEAVKQTGLLSAVMQNQIDQLLG